MFQAEVAKRFAKAKAANHRFLLVCFDTWDRLKFDEDLGYYYPCIDSPEAVREYLEGKQLGEWNPKNLADCCEAVIDLDACGSEYKPEFCRKPQEWLSGNP